MHGRLPQAHCFRLEAHMGKPNCTSNGIFRADCCFGRQEFDASQRESIISGEIEFFLPCRCYELNCTAEMAKIEFEFFESPTSANPVLSLALSLSPPPSPLWALSLLPLSFSLFPINAHPFTWQWRQDWLRSTGQLKLENQLDRFEISPGQPESTSGCNNYIIA